MTGFVFQMKCSILMLSLGILPSRFLRQIHLKERDRKQFEEKHNAGLEATEFVSPRR